MIKHNLKIYESYKEVESLWIGEVPSHWISGRVKDFVVNDTTTKIPIKLKENDLVEFIPMSNVNEEVGKVRRFDFVPLKEVSSGYTKFKNKDVIFAKITPCMENGNCAIVDGLINNIGFGSTEFMVFRTSKKVSERYLHYFFHNELFRKNAEPFMRGTAGQKRITTQYMITHYLPLPTISEQLEIADYLDRKTTQIGKMIELHTKKLEHYISLKKSLINETVTKGIDKTVEMKDSYINWVGDIPEHWNIERIGTAFDERREKVSDSDYPPLSVTMKGIVTQLDTAAKTDHNDNRKRVAINDFVINSRSDRRGSSGISELEGSVSVINIVLKPRKNFYGRYLHHLFRSYRFIEEFYRVGRGIVDDLWTTKYSVMKAIEFAFPGYEEQKTIADYLDNKISQIDGITESIETQISRLKELRSTLINEVVTGKVKVVKEVK
jgi:type I restriction enzyme, S subunit